MTVNSFPRKNTKLIKLGGIAIGGGSPISIQSMTNTPTADIAATGAQIDALAAAGCDICRLAIPDMDAAAALPELIACSSMPLVADIHFDYRLALAAIKAGVAGLRLNPGNIGSAVRVKEVTAAAKAADVPIRIGVNGGSLEKDLLVKYGGITAEAMVESAWRHIHILEEENFDQIKVSLKSSDLVTMISAYRLMAEQCDYPLHIGLTEAGTAWRGGLRSAAAIGALLAEGIGDTIRVSVSGDPVQEVRIARELLSALNLRAGGWQFIACPTCGRTNIDVAGIMARVEEALEGINPSRLIKVAVMGCAVNGPGEAREADVGIAGGDGRGVLFKSGEIVDHYAEEELAAVLIAEAQKITNYK